MQTLVRRSAKRVGPKLIKKSMKHFKS